MIYLFAGASSPSSIHPDLIWGESEFNLGGRGMIDDMALQEYREKGEEGGERREGSEGRGV